MVQVKSHRSNRFRSPAIAPKLDVSVEIKCLMSTGSKNNLCVHDAGKTNKENETKKENKLKIMNYENV